MLRIVIEVDTSNHEPIATKEAIAMALEPFGNVRVVSVIPDGRDHK